jgi:uncharacterized lipoprotein YddW (UPF0748 family)
MRRTITVLLVLIVFAAPGRVFARSVAEMPSSLPVRAVWVHPGFFGVEKAACLEKMESTLDAYRRAGINTLIVLVKDTSGYVFYPSRIAVQSPRYDWDFFGEFLARARKRNMEVQPWFCVFHETSILGRVREHPEWLIMSPRREMVGSVNPALPAVRSYELSLIMEVAARYNVDWIHLDYIRFPCEPTEPFFGYDPETLRIFKDETGIDLNAVMAHDSGNILWNTWLSWNRSRVTRFVAELRDALNATGRSVWISAAVFPDADNAKVLIGQDWAAWAEERLVDMLCPMLYTNDTGSFEAFARRAVAAGRGHCRVCPGIGIGTSHNQNTPEGMIEEMRICRSIGADGVVFFSSSSLGAPFLEWLRTEK